MCATFETTRLIFNESLETSLIFNESPDRIRQFYIRRFDFTIYVRLLKQF